MSIVDTHQHRFKLLCNKIGGKFPLAIDGDVNGLISLNERMFSAFEALEIHSKCVDATHKTVQFWIDLRNESKNDCHYLLGKVNDSCSCPDYSNLIHISKMIFPEKKLSVHVTIV